MAKALLAPVYFVFSGTGHRGQCPKPLPCHPGIGDVFFHSNQLFLVATKNNFSDRLKLRFEFLN